jgi:hypothetical protein
MTQSLEVRFGQSPIGRTRGSSWSAASDPERRPKGPWERRELPDAQSKPVAWRMRRTQFMWCRPIALTVLLASAAPALAAGRGALAISVTVVRSIAVTTSGDRPATASVAVRAPDGTRWSAPVAGARPARAMAVSTQTASGEIPGYLVVTVLTDASTRW